MSPVLFWLLATLMLGFGLAVVVNRNPVASALSLVVSFLCLASLYVSLDAFFIGVIQVLVYAGAVMVLFLFIIMLLDIKETRRRKLNTFGALGGAAIASAFILQLWYVLDSFTMGKNAFPAFGVHTARELDDVRQVGMTLFTTHNLPFQVIGALVLVATVGVIILSRRELK
jgi:NADH-quinone oxidoreductase subunit J